MDNILKLHQDLRNKSYKHSRYHAFKINDPKPRDIHKATVTDRIVHHAVYRILYPYFDRKFVFDSYSCRTNKGLHKAINRFRDIARKISCNNTKTAWVLKCDIKKFFATISHDVLEDILKENLKDEDVIWLLEEIIGSFQTQKGIGLPLGNVTSQLFINIYMNEFDHFVKRKLKARHYIRYSDDFIILHSDKTQLEAFIPQMSQFLENNLKLSLHEKKIFIKRLSSGVDFLGWTHFPYHRTLRSATRRRMVKRLKRSTSRETIASYLGLLKHGNTFELANKIKQIYK